MDFSTYPIKENNKVSSILVVAKDVTEQKETENKYRLITESSLDVIFALTKTGKLTYISPSSKELFGFEPNEMIGTSFIKYVTKAELPKYWKTPKEVIFHKKISGFETYVKHRNGSLIPVEINGQTLERDRKFVAQGTIRDITERKKAEATMQESEKKHKAIFENTGTAMAIIEKDTTISLVNKGFVDLSGFSREEIEGKKHWTEFVVKEDLEKMKNQHNFRRMDTEAALKNYEFRFADKDGKVKDISISIDVIPGTAKSVASLLDITEHKQAEEQNRKFNKIIETTSQSVIITNIKGTVLYVNPSYYAFSGFVEDEVIGKSMYRFAHKKGAIKLAKEVVPALIKMK
ncbi:MAG: PAS domain-containing protein [Candidatus Heimdallarchaeaceae archaeon]